MANIDTNEILVELEGIADDVALEAANRWFSAANEILLSAGDEMEYEVFPVVQGGQPPEWDDSRGGFSMVWRHAASAFFEHGTTKHEVEGNPILAFEWEEMRGEEFGDTGKTFEEVFDTFPTVFLPRVTVSGIPAIRYNQRAMDRAAAWLEEGDH